MQCTDFRKLVGADPQHLSAEARAHMQECPACAEYARQMLQLDGMLKRALEIPVSAPAMPTPAVQPPQRWYALAASVLLAVIVSAAVWLAVPRASLAADLVAHMNHEPTAMLPTTQREEPETLSAVLQRAGITLDPIASDISYAETCPIRGHRVPHLVVQTQSGPVTVIVLPDEQVDGRQSFVQDGYRGVVVPSGAGSIAVISTDVATVEMAAQKVAAAVHWTR